MVVDSHRRPGESGAHIVTVNPFGAIPDLVLSVIARFAGPNGGDQGLGTAARLSPGRAAHR